MYTITHRWDPTFIWTIYTRVGHLCKYAQVGCFDDCFSSFNTHHIPVFCKFVYFQASGPMHHMATTSYRIMLLSFLAVCLALHFGCVFLVVLRNIYFVITNCNFQDLKLDAKTFVKQSSNNCRVWKNTFPITILHIMKFQASIIQSCK